MGMFVRARANYIFHRAVIPQFDIMTFILSLGALMWHTAQCICCGHLIIEVRQVVSTEEKVNFNILNYIL